MAPCVYQAWGGYHIGCYYPSLTSKPASPGGMQRPTAVRATNPIPDDIHPDCLAITPPCKSPLMGCIYISQGAPWLGCRYPKVTAKPGTGPAEPDRARPGRLVAQPRSTRMVPRQLNRAPMPS